MERANKIFPGVGKKVDQDAENGIPINSLESQAPKEKSPSVDAKGLNPVPSPGNCSPGETAADASKKSTYKVDQDAENRIPHISNLESQVPKTTSTSVDVKDLNPIPSPGETAADAPKNDSDCWTCISKAPRWVSWVVFMIILIVLLVFRGVNTFTPSIPENTVLIVYKFAFIILVVIGVISFFIIPKFLKKPQVTRNTSDEKPLEKDQSAPKKVQLYYFDKVRILLAVAIVTFHTLLVFLERQLSNGAWGPGYQFTADRNSGLQTVGVAFMYSGQSFAMCMFFFIAGYFTPTSFDRQLSRSNGTMGYWYFLKSKFKRIGCPLLVCFFVLEPLRNMMAQAFVGAPISYNPAFGVCWFLAWLLIFIVCYVFVGGDPVVRKRPWFLWMCLVCLVLSIVQGIVIIVAPSQFIGMPMGHGSLPFDILFFTCGVLAKRGGWLDEPRPTVSVVAAWVLVAIAIVYYFVYAWATVYCDSTFIRMFGYFCPSPVRNANETILQCAPIEALAECHETCCNMNTTYAQLGCWKCTSAVRLWCVRVCECTAPLCSLYLTAPHEQTGNATYPDCPLCWEFKILPGCDICFNYEPPPIDANPEWWPLTQIPYRQLMGSNVFLAISGLAVVAFNFGILDLCQRRCNHKSSPFGKQLSNASYAAYVLHPLFINPASFVWQLIMSATGSPIERPDQTTPKPLFSPMQYNWNGDVDLNMSPGQQWGGLVFVVLLTQVSVWAVSIGIKNTPVLKDLI